MGLDQAVRRMTPELAAKILKGQELELEWEDLTDQQREEFSLTREEYDTVEEVWTGRKENHLQRAIEQMKGQSAVNCGYLFLNRLDIALLVRSLRMVHDNHDLASAVLPTQSGFFYGSTEYDEWYFDDIKRELEDFEQILRDWDESAAYAYWAWW
jgi:hypothetical protein